MNEKFKKMNEMLEENKSLVWITNIEQSCFYIKNDIRPVDVYLNKNGLVAIAFKKEDTRAIYDVWKRFNN